MKKKEKLCIITPLGEKVELGFLSPSSDGVVIGIPELEDFDKHLTIYSKDDTLFSHITPQKSPENRQYFPPIRKSEITKRFKMMVKQELISPLSVGQLSNQVVYFTKKFKNWFETINKVLHQIEETRKEIIHLINFKDFLEKAPQLVKELQKNPSAFLGLCLAKEILDDKSKIMGFNDTGLMLLPFEGRLYQVNLFGLLNFNFNSNIKQQEISHPFEDIFQSFGISQYMKEIQEKKIIEKLFSTDVGNPES